MSAEYRIDVLRSSAWKLNCFWLHTGVDLSQLRVLSDEHRAEWRRRTRRRQKSVAIKLSMRKSPQLERSSLLVFSRFALLSAFLVCI